MRTLFATETEEKEALALCEEIRSLLDAQQRGFEVINKSLDRIEPLFAERVVQ